MQMRRIRWIVVQRRANCHIDVVSFVKYEVEAEGHTCHLADAILG